MDFLSLVELAENEQYCIQPVHCQLGRKYNGYWNRSFRRAFLTSITVSSFTGCVYFRVYCKDNIIYLESFIKFLLWLNYFQRQKDDKAFGNGSKRSKRPISVRNGRTSPRQGAKRLLAVLVHVEEEVCTPEKHPVCLCKQSDPCQERPRTIVFAHGDRIEQINVRISFPECHYVLT